MTSPWPVRSPSTALAGLLCVRGAVLKLISVLTKSDRQRPNRDERWTDFPGLIDQGVPGVATVIDDVVERFEDAVREPVLTHELPDVFLAVELGA